MADDKNIPDLPPRRTSKLPTKLSLSDIEALTPDLRRDLLSTHGLEVRADSSAPEALKNLLTKVAATNSPLEAQYDKVYDRTSPGYDRSYDRG